MSNTTLRARETGAVCSSKHCGCAKRSDFLGDSPAAGETDAASQLDDHGHSHAHAHGEPAGSWKIRLLLPGLLFVVGLVFDDWVTAVIGRYLFYAMMLAAYLLCGLPVLRQAWRAILDRDFFNEFTLMSLATLVAIGLGDVAEAVGVMLFYAIGETLQDKAAGNSRGSIKSLLASKPDKATLIVDGEAKSVSPENVAVGSMILVKPGEKIPLDGEIVSDAANVDMSSLTGEPVPAPVGEGDKVFSGTIALDGDLNIRTTAVYSDSAVGRILAMVEDAAGRKSRTERFISAFARYYTPVVVAAALLVAVLPPLFFGGLWQVWVYRALVLLVVSCPCALVLSVPLAFFAGIGAMSKHGVLIKGGNVFDALVRADSVIFDKTGTLTEGKPSLVEAKPAAGLTREELIRLAATAESRSNHPAARAVAAVAGEGFVFPDKVSVKDVAGKGIIASAPEGEIAVGNQALFNQLDIALPPDTSDLLVSYVALDGKYAGSLSFEDKIKPDAVEAVKDLRNCSGMKKMFMLTGDRPEVAEKVAKQVGMDDYRAALLPGGKVDAYVELSPNGTAVFVGDGVNDAPVLARAGVGVAMAALGAASAVEAADVAVLDDSPSRLPILFKAAAKVRSVVWQNIFFALAVKATFMALGVIGLSGLWEAVFADVGVALLSVVNAMRMTRV